MSDQREAEDTLRSGNKPQVALVVTAVIIPPAIIGANPAISIHFTGAKMGARLGITVLEQIIEGAAQERERVLQGMARAIGSNGPSRIKM